MQAISLNFRYYSERIAKVKALPPDALQIRPATAVRDAVRGRLESGREMNLHYDPILMLQHLIWHEGYHHGQIKPALKLAGLPFEDERIGPLTWDVWMEKAK